MESYGSQNEHMILPELDTYADRDCLSFKLKVFTSGQTEIDLNITALTIARSRSKTSAWSCY